MSLSRTVSGIFGSKEWRDLEIWVRGSFKIIENGSIWKLRYCFLFAFHSNYGLERLDDRRDMITQSLFRQIKDPKHPLHYICYLLLKCLIVRWFCGLHIHIKFHWPKLHVMEGTLYHIALPISFSSAAQSSCLGLFYVRVFDCYINWLALFCLCYCLTF